MIPNPKHEILKQPSEFAIEFRIKNRGKNNMIGIAKVKINAAELIFLGGGVKPIFFHRAIIA